MNKDFTPEQSLRVIEDMIHRTRANFKETNQYFIAWGIFISLAALIEYVLIRYTDFEYYYIPWIIFPLVGTLWSIRQGRRDDRGGSTILGDGLKWIWIGMGIGFTITFFISWRIQLNPTPVMLLLSGIGTFITSRILSSVPYLVGSIFLFAMVVVSLYIGGVDSLLLVAVSMILGYIVPATLENRTVDA